MMGNRLLLLTRALTTMASPPANKSARTPVAAALRRKVQTAREGANSNCSPAKTLADLAFAATLTVDEIIIYGRRCGSFDEGADGRADLPCAALSSHF